MRLANWVSPMFRYKRKKEILEKVAYLVRAAELSDIPILLHLLSEYPQAANKPNQFLDVHSPFEYSMMQQRIPPDFALSMWKMGVADVAKEPDFYHENGFKPIIAALSCPEFLPILKDCIDKGVDPNTTGSFQQSLIDQAARFYNYEAIEYLLNLKDTNKDLFDGIGYWQDGMMFNASEEQILKYRPHMLCDENRMEKTYHLLMTSGKNVNEEEYDQFDDRISEHINLGVHLINYPIELFSSIAAGHLRAGGAFAETVKIKNKILLRNRTN